MSIFSGWEAGDFGRLTEVLTGSPQGLIMLVVFVLILIALISLLVHIISHQISGFYVRITGEEEEDGDEQETKGTGSPDRPVSDQQGSGPQPGRLPEPGQGKEDAADGRALKNRDEGCSDSEMNGEVLS